MKMLRIPTLALALIPAAAAAQVAPANKAPPPIILKKDTGISPGAAAALQGGLPQVVDGSFSIIGQGNLRWTGGFCAPKANESDAVCVKPMTVGRAVTLQANPRPGQVFKGWAGACSGTSPTCTITPSKKFAVSASFAAAPPPPQTGRTLTVFLPPDTSVQAIARSVSPFGNNNDPGTPLAGTCGNAMSNPGSGHFITKACTFTTNAALIDLIGKYDVAKGGTQATGQDWSGDCYSRDATRCIIFLDKNKSIFLSNKGSSGGPISTGSRSLKIYFSSIGNSTVSVMAKKRGYTPFGNDPGVFVATNCGPIITPMGMIGPGGTYNGVCTIVSDFALFDLTAYYEINGQKIAVAGPTAWLGGACTGTPDAACHVTLEKDKQVYIRPQN